MNDWRPGGWWAPSPVQSAFLVLAVVLAASVTGLGNGFAYDDFHIIANNVRVTEWRSPWAFFSESYWGPMRGNALYRPLTVLSYSLQWAAGDGSPLVFHLFSVTLYAATALGVLALGVQLLPPIGALAAALLFAAHPVHVEAVGNVVGQAELWVALAMLLAVTRYISDRRAGGLTREGALVIIGCFTLSLLIKENGIILPGLLLAAELALADRLRPRERGDWARLRLLILLLGLIVALYLVMRVSVTGSLAGDNANPAISGLGFGSRAWVMLGVAPEFLRLFLWPARLYADYSPPFIARHLEPSLAHLAGVAVVGLWGVLCWWGWRRDRVVAFGMLWLPVTMALIANLLIPTGVFLAERTLFLPSVGVVLVMGAMVARVAPMVRRADPPLPTVGIVAFLLLVGLGIAQSAERQYAWKDNATVFATLVTDAPTNFRGRYGLGKLYFDHGLKAKGEREWLIGERLFPEYAELPMSLARIYHREHRCEQAMPFYDRTLALEPEAQVALVGRAACLLELARYRDARLQALSGLATGYSSSAFRLMRDKADSALAATDSIDPRNRWVRMGRPYAAGGQRLEVRVGLNP